MFNNKDCSKEYRKTHLRNSHHPGSPKEESPLYDPYLDGDGFGSLNSRKVIVVLGWQNLLEISPVVLGKAIHREMSNWKSSAKELSKVGAGGS